MPIPQKSFFLQDLQDLRIDTTYSRGERQDGQDAHPTKIIFSSRLTGLTHGRHIQ